MPAGLCVCCVVVSPQQLELLTPFQLYFNPDLIFRKLQVSAAGGSRSASARGEAPGVPGPRRPLLLPPLSSLAGLEAGHQLPLFRAPGIQFLFQHDISVSFGRSAAPSSALRVIPSPPLSCSILIRLCSPLGLGASLSAPALSRSRPQAATAVPAAPQPRAACGGCSSCWGAAPGPGAEPGLAAAQQLLFASPAVSAARWRSLSCALGLGHLAAGFL